MAAEEGGRRGETLALRWGCVDFDTGVLTIDATITRGDDGVKLRHRTKTKKPRRIAVSSCTLELLIDLKRRTEEQLSSAAGTVVCLGRDDFVFSGGVGSRRHPLDGRPWDPSSTTPVPAPQGAGGRPQ